MTMPTESTQANKIFNHLRFRGPLTPKDALELFGCFRLAARIHDLRNKGFNIKTHKARGGYAIYTLLPSPWEGR